MTSSLVLYSDRVLSPGQFDRPEPDKPELVSAALDIRGASITAIHWNVTLPEARALARAREADFHDFGAQVITPAFVNAHTHLALGFLRASEPGPAGSDNMVERLFFEVERRLEPDDVRAFVRMGAYESLLNGVGMVWDHYYFADSVIEGLLDTGLSAVVAPTLQDLAGPGQDHWRSQLEATRRLAVDDSLRQRGLFAALGPHATDTVSIDLWQRSAALAEELELPFHAHAAQSLEEVERAWERHGFSPVAWLSSLGIFEQIPRTLLTHCLFTSRRELEALDPARVAIAFCPCSQKVFGFAADPSRFSDAGLEWIVATDTSAGNDSMNLQKELKSVAELRTTGISSGPTWQEFFDSNSLEAARRAWAERQRRFHRHQHLAEPQALLDRVWGAPGALHPHVRVGRIEVGALANLAVWRTDDPSFWPCPDARNLLGRLAMSDTSSALHALVIAGRMIGEPGDLRRSLVDSPQYQAALEEAERRRRAVLASS